MFFFFAEWDVFILLSSGFVTENSSSKRNVRLIFILNIVLGIVESSTPRHCPFIYCRQAAITSIAIVCVMSAAFATIITIAANDRKSLLPLSPLSQIAPVNTIFILEAITTDHVLGLPSHCKRYSCRHPHWCSHNHLITFTGVNI